MMKDADLKQAYLPLEKSKLVFVSYYVYCNTHGDIHENTLDPYQEGSPTCYGGEYGLTKDMVHRTVYYRARKGDFE
jgi:hypothetical protein